MSPAKPEAVKAVVMTAPSQMEMRSYAYPQCDRDSAILKVEMTRVCGTAMRRANALRSMILALVGLLGCGALAQATDSPAAVEFDWQGKGGFDTHRWGGFLLANNRWGGGEGRIWFRAGEKGWSFWTEHQDDLGGGHVKSFPHAGIGWFWGSWAPNPALPVPLGELAVAKSSWTVTLPKKAAGQSYVVYYQFYTATVPDPKRDTSTISGDLAVIVHREDFPFEQWGKRLGEFEVGGRRMLVVHKAPAIGKSTYIIMIPLEPLAKREGDRLRVEDFDLRPCVDFCVAHGHFKATDYLITIQAGWEIRALHGVLQSDNLTLTVGSTGKQPVSLPLPPMDPAR